MTVRSFVDTNVWVYAVDTADPAKQQRARDVLDPTTTDALVISAQVLGEFYVTVTRKLERPVEPALARTMVERMSRLPVVAVDADQVAAAIVGSQEWGIAYWDALLVASAASAGCGRLLSEDLSDGAQYGTVRVENPFRERRVSEALADYASGVASWDDDSLAAELARYEQAARDAGMRSNAVHSYWDYARRFLDWRTGDYRPRGAPMSDRPVPNHTVTADILAEQASAYAAAIEAARRSQDTVDTYHRHAMFFIRWLRGDFTPGGRLRSRQVGRSV